MLYYAQIENQTQMKAYQVYSLLIGTMSLGCYAILLYLDPGRFMGAAAPTIVAIAVFTGILMRFIRSKDVVQHQKAAHFSIICGTTALLLMVAGFFFWTASVNNIGVVELVSLWF